MNGFDSKGLDEDAFGDKAGLSSGLKTFDAFRESFQSQWPAPRTATMHPNSNHKPKPDNC